VKLEEVPKVIVVVLDEIPIGRAHQTVGPETRKHPGGDELSQDIFELEGLFSEGPQNGFSAQLPLAENPRLVALANPEA